MCMPRASLHLAIDPSQQTSSPFHFWPALWLSYSPNCCCSPGIQSKPRTHPGWERKWLNTEPHQRWAQGASHSPELWGTIFQDLPELLMFGWNQEGETTKVVFSETNPLMRVRKICGRDGWQHCGAHVIIQASIFWLLLHPRERQAQKSRKQLINFLTWPRNQTDTFQRELQPSGRDCGREG